jgi:hypothetical protein
LAAAAARLIKRFGDGSGQPKILLAETEAESKVTAIRFSEFCTHTKFFHTFSPLVITGILCTIGIKIIREL